MVRGLDGLDGVRVNVQHFPSGDVRGYKIAIEGDTNAAGQPIWFSGSEPAPDLHLRAVLPERADEVLADPAWPALAAALTQAKNAGHDPQQLLQHAARQRALDDARSTARSLTWRIKRLGAWPAPSEQARAAQAHTATITRATPPPSSAPSTPPVATSTVNDSSRRR
ncbi:hypothetical protein [Streptomyces sp. NK08204]|uniref:hypothetical protein n=1 Tax=Streptomyces sp. NK08204 TaxID=2873260 RepID=UPI001CEC4A2F|nr:hypothetical protein [Streptomyces sp. NK08204]